MSTTNFGALTQEQLTVWSRDFWREARNRSFIMSFAGDSAGSMIQRITELRKTNDGARAVITLINEATGDGVVGDNQLEGNEEALSAVDQVITIDQWRKAHRSKGEMAEQASVVQFRKEARDQLSYTAARVMDELAFLTMSGVSYAYHTNGKQRTGSELSNLSFASAVSAPTSKRHFRWSATAGLTAGDTTAVAVGDTPSWAMLVDAKAAASENFIRPMRTDNGVECYNVFLSPRGMAALKKDKDFIDALKHAQTRGDKNPLFTGTKVGGKEGIYVDGLNILEYRNVYNTLGAGAGAKWGAGGNVDGQRILLCGAQAMAFADIGGAKWVEKKFDYDNQDGVSIGKKIGFLKPSMFNTYAQSKQDFGLMVIDTALA